VENAVAQLVQTDKLFIETGIQVDADAEKKKISEEMAYLEGFIASVEKKLSNEKFVNNAPAAVLDLERKKQADAESIIASLKESIAALRKQ